MTDQPTSHKAATDQWRAQPDDPIRVQLARYAHGAWAGWMRYLFSKSLMEEDGALLSRSYVANLQRQMDTAYDDLPVATQRLDLEEADKILAIIQANINYTQPQVVITVFDGEKIHRVHYHIPAIELSMFQVDNDTAATLIERVKHYLIGQFALSSRMGGTKRR